MKKILLLVVLFGFFWNYKEDIQNYWEDSEVKKELSFLEEFDSNDMEKTIVELKAQLIDLQKKYESKKDHGVEKVLEVKTALEESQQALRDLQDAVENLKLSGKKVKSAFSGE